MSYTCDKITIDEVRQLMGERHEVKLGDKPTIPPITMERIAWWTFDAIVVRFEALMTDGQISPEQSYNGVVANALYDNDYRGAELYIDAVKMIATTMLNETGSEWRNDNGRWAKRFAKVFNSHLRSRKLSKYEINQVANLAQNSISGGTWTVDIVDKIDWRRGAFGNKKSCWWSEYSQSLYTFNNNDKLFCMRNWHEISNGRVFFVVTEGGRIVTFNSYGQWTMTTAASVLAQLLGAEKHRSDTLRFNGDNEDVLYINDAGFYTVSRNDQRGGNIPYDVQVECFSTPQTPLDHSVSLNGKCNACEEDLYGYDYLEFEYTRYCENCYAKKRGT